MRLNAWTVLSLLLLLAGVGFYLAMGLSYGNWTDIGVYSVTIVLLGFGAFGLMAALRPRPA